MSTTRPSNLPEWGTDASTDKTAPASTVAQAGWAAFETMANNVVNWFWNQAYEWIEYLDTHPRFRMCSGYHSLWILGASNTASEVPAEQFGAVLRASTTSSTKYAPVYLRLDEAFSVKVGQNLHLIEFDVLHASTGSGTDRIEWLLTSDDYFGNTATLTSGTLPNQVYGWDTVTIGEDLELQSDLAYRLEFRIYPSGSSNFDCFLAAVRPHIRRIDP